MFNAEKNNSQAESTKPTAAGELWHAPYTSTPVNARVSLPGSKSLSNRELILAALAATPSTLTGVLRSRDTDLMIAALEQLGTKIAKIPGDDPLNYTLHITPAAKLQGPATIECGLAGTVMRFMPAVAALASTQIMFDGDPYARKRPMQPVLQALAQLGANIVDDGRGALPFTVHGSGRLRGGRVEIDASLSSQFVSGLLLAAARFENGVHVVHRGATLPSVPHIEMTLKCLHQRGITAHSPAPGEWIVEPGSIKAVDLTIEPDLSNAAPFLAAALVTSGTVTIPNWPTATTQVGDQLRDILPRFGANVTLNRSELQITGSGAIRGVRLHLPEAGELAPTLVGLAALASEPSEFTGIGHIRHHETDRIKALVTEINALGGNAQELPGGIKITPATLHGGLWRAYADHRMATTGAVIGLKTPGVIIDDIASTGKTMPDFVEMWNQLLGRG